MTLVLVAAGVMFVAGGGWLVALGGSPYYLITGLVNLVVAGCIARGRPAALYFYAAFSVSTLVWAIAEAGLDPWALLPRIVCPVALGLWFAFPKPAKSLGLSGLERCLMPAIFALALVLLLGSFLAAAPHLGESQKALVSGDDRTWQWQSYGGDVGGQRHAPFDQINLKNVSELTEAWSFRTGHGVFKGRPVSGTTFEATPVQVGRQVVFCTPFNVVTSVDGDSGRELWRFDPKIDRTAPVTFVCRGVAYYAGAGVGDCSQRILTATLDNRLFALDVWTGRLCRDFGRNGVVDLAQGLGKVLAGYHAVTSPPTIINGVAVVGSFVLDDQSTDEPSGVVRGYDVQTGKLLWAWDGLDPRAVPPLGPGEVYARSSPNSWSVGSADPNLGLVYLPTGGITPDFFHGRQPPARERYGSSIVALDARTGDVRWSFQTVHHDVWDYDVASQPVLFEFPVGATSIPALAAPTKRGEIFILDRRTGRPLVPVEERRVPGNGAPGEALAPTQPFVTGFPSFASPKLTEAMMWGLTPFDQLWCRLKFRRNLYDGPFTPLSTRGSIVSPGEFGGFNWGSVSNDPDRKLLVGNFNWIPYVGHLIPRREADAMKLYPADTTAGPRFQIEHGQTALAQAGTPYAVSIGPFVSPLGVPCTQPPWGQIGAIDLQSRKVRWLRPLGTTRDIAPFDIALPLGVPNAGGAITTRGGLTFVAAAMDHYIRAFDSETGAEVWRARLPAGGQATPMTYISPRTGRQYVVIAVGGHASLGSTPGDYLIAFSLPHEAGR